MNSRLCLTVVFLLSLGAVSLGQDWTQWRGPNREGISSETGLLKQWPESGPKVVWQVDTVGVGYSSPSIKGGKIFTQGDLHGVEHAICLNAEDGRVLWAVQPEPVGKALEERAVLARARQ